MQLRAGSRALRRAIALAVIGACVATGAAAAQQAPPRDDGPPLCLGFTFGAWTPPLDWRAAGHGAPIDTARLARAPGGREWAVQGGATKADSSFVLFPAWWPAGVAVELPRRTATPGDTVVGRAIAFVANGNHPNPMSRVRVWQVPCSR